MPASGLSWQADDDELIVALLAKRVVIALRGSERLGGFFDSPGASRFQVFDAYDGRLHAGDEYFDRDAFAVVEKRQAKPAEVGCAISHLLVMREFATEEGGDDDMMLVAEDDARPADNWLSVVNSILSHRDGFDYVLLANPFDDVGEKSLVSISTKLGQLSYLARRVGRPYRIGSLRGIMRGTGLYLVSRRAARQYVELVNSRGGKIGWCADTYEAWMPVAGMRQIVVEPNLAGWSGDSSIQEVSSLRFNRDKREALMGDSLLGRVRSNVALRTRMNHVANRISATIDDISGRRCRKAND